MYSKHLLHVKDNSYKYNEFEKVSFNMECLIFDTESCQKIEGDNSSAKVYGWGLGCTRSEKMLYGQNLNQFFKTCENLFLNYCEKNKRYISPIKDKKTKKYESYKYIKIPCAVHNLSWDMEFLKYSLIDNGYNYKMGIKKQVKNYETCVDVQQEKTFHIVQNEGIVYGSTIYFPFNFEIKNKDNSITKIGLCLDIFDSYKIITCGESKFKNYVHGIDPIFYKMGEAYNYELYRSDEHWQNDLELRYQYNDIYMLRVTLEQFYIDGLMEGKMPTLGNRTASSIAFNKLKKMTFGDNKTEEIYNNYFELDKKTTFETTRKRIEKESYTGGYTHANHIFVTQEINKICCSLDINSSYPYQMYSKIFPYGRPTKKLYGEVPIIDKDNQVFLIEVGFDYVKPKNKKFDLAIFKIGSANIKKLSEIVGDISGQEYFSTNIKNGKIYKVVKPIDNTHLKSLYNVVLTNFEFEFWNKHFDFGCFKIDEFGCYLDNVKEIEFNGLEIGESLVYKAEKGKFKKFVEYFTKMKIENKDNKPLKNQAKIFLNSCYGKFGTKSEKYEQDLLLDNNGVYYFSTDNEIKYEGKEFYRPYASFVTSYGRLQLWNTIIYAVGVNNFLYADTDSIYSIRKPQELKKDMEKIGEKIDKTELGKWDIEHVITKFKVLGQKKYIYKAYIYNKEGEIIGDENILKCCGLPYEAQKMISSKKWHLELLKDFKICNVKRGKINKKVKDPFKEFYLGKNVKGKKQRKKVIGGCLLLDTVFTIKRLMW